MEYSEIAKQLGVTESTVYELAARGLRKIARTGNMETFATVVRLTEIKKAHEAFIRCGSIECRPEKWVFFGVEMR